MHRREDDHIEVRNMRSEGKGGIMGDGGSRQSQKGRGWVTRDEEGGGGRGERERKEQGEENGRVGEEILEGGERCMLEI